MVVSTGQSFGELSDPLRRFGELSSMDILRDNRNYSFLIVLDLLFRRGLSLTQDLRVSPKFEYKASDLFRPLDDIILSSGEEIPLYLYRLKTGSHEHRRRYESIANTFDLLTNKPIDITVTPFLTQEPDTGTFDIEPVIKSKLGDIPIRFAGAGIWEALFLSTLISHEQVKTILLDEPALNLHPILQRRVLDKLSTTKAQHIVITHSPYLVPSTTKDDLYRIIRFSNQDGITSFTRLEKTQSTPERQPELNRFIKELAKTVGAPSLLFAQGVILTEGETESGALPVWIDKACEFGPTSLNISILSVDGDHNFKTYVRYLEVFDIPWAIICDGPILQDGQIFEQTGVNISDSQRKAPFQEMVGNCKSYGIFTLVSDYEQEFEDIPYVQPHGKEAKRMVGRSKVRQGRYIAQKTECPDGVKQLYYTILEHFNFSNARMRM